MIDRRKEEREPTSSRTLRWTLIIIVTSLEFVPLDMLNRNICLRGTNECHRFIVHRNRRVAVVSDQRLRVQPAKLERRSVMAIDRRGTHRPFDLHG